VKKLWKAGRNSSFLRLRILARGGASRSPLQNRPRPLLELPAHEPPGSDSAGLSPIRMQGAREKCFDTIDGVHTTCTVFPQDHFVLEKRLFHKFMPVNHKTFPGQSRSNRLEHQWPCEKLIVVQTSFTWHGQVYEDRDDEELGATHRSIIEARDYFGTWPYSVALFRCLIPRRCRRAFDPVLWVP
jgi:hypothetical protein